MNYRVLFTIAILVITVGVVGLIYLPDSHTDTSETAQTNEQSTQTATQAKVQTHSITIATLNHAVKAGQLLTADDYTLSQKEVAGESNDDLTAFIDGLPNHSLQGVLVGENMAEGSKLTPSALVSPNDPRFLSTSLDPKKEVAYNLCLRSKDAYLLNTLQSGAKVDLFIQANDFNSNQSSLTPVFLDVTLLRLTPNNNEEENKNQDSCAAFALLKLTAEKVKSLYRLPQNAGLVMLPASEVHQVPAQNKGIFIRSLRG